MWHFGIRRTKDGGYIITEEFPGYGYAVHGRIEPGYPRKWLDIMMKDITQQLKSRIKKKRSLLKGEFKKEELQ